MFLLPRARNFHGGALRQVERAPPTPNETREAGKGNTGRRAETSQLFEATIAELEGMSTRKIILSGDLLTDTREDL